MLRYVVLLAVCGSLFIASAFGVEPLAYRAALTFSAPEAHQAAASDERFFYAITNVKVAQYDRVTGKQVAVSHGPAKHLNSGFFWEGKLYCAHSNYPAQPERSELKVLNLASMELSSSHDFGDFGGSLTWAVCKNGAWYCNFARYGEHNRETFLVRFDDSWQEQARWCYPAEVLDKLGTYSLSGGVWLDDAWLVTGHDDRVIFKLREPAQGGCLEYVETIAVPFTGQGIALDPVSKGLVGIDRRERKVIFAQRASARADGQEQ